MAKKNRKKKSKATPSSAPTATPAQTTKPTTVPPVVSKDQQAQNQEPQQPSKLKDETAASVTATTQTPSACTIPAIATDEQEQEQAAEQIEETNHVNNNNDTAAASETATTTPTKATSTTTTQTAIDSSPATASADTTTATTTATATATATTTATTDEQQQQQQAVEKNEESNHENNKINGDRYEDENDGKGGDNDGEDDDDKTTTTDNKSSSKQQRNNNDNSSSNNNNNNNKTKMRTQLSEENASTIASTDESDASVDEEALENCEPYYSRQTSMASSEGAADEQQPQDVVVFLSAAAAATNDHEKLSLSSSAADSTIDNDETSKGTSQKTASAPDTVASLGMSVSALPSLREDEEMSHSDLQVGQQELQVAAPDTATTNAAPTDPASTAPESTKPPDSLTADSSSTVTVPSPTNKVISYSSQPSPPTVASNAAILTTTALATGSSTPPATTTTTSLNSTSTTTTTTTTTTNKTPVKKSGASASRQPHSVIDRPNMKPSPFAKHNRLMSLEPGVDLEAIEYMNEEQEEIAKLKAAQPQAKTKEKPPPLPAKEKAVKTTSLSSTGGGDATTTKEKDASGKAEKTDKGDGTTTTTTREKPVRVKQSSNLKKISKPKLASSSSTAGSSTGGPQNVSGAASGGATSGKQLPFIPAAVEPKRSTSSAATGDDAAGNNHNNNKNNADEDDSRIRLGICAMDKKARSKPMAEILSRLDETLFQVVFFGDQVIITEPIENWPICDVLIAFFSKGYPLPKAKEYVELRKPFILNDLEMQQLLQDRRRVYDLLEASGIDVPRHAYLSRDGYVSTGTGDGNGNQDTEVQEFDDHIEVNGASIHKPFVEKPVSAEDHNIAIYYPTSAGGGCKKLFRKIGNRSSEFYPGINEVRRDGSYIYEEFVETQGTDVKMYTVGPEYGHAEARKSPTVDGKVERNSEGKEVRFPVILTLREKEIARRIVLVFRQFVCGFDILRVQEGHSVVSYVCDVNGFSFVKNSRKYYDDCSQILSEHILALVKPAALTRISTLDPLMTTNTNHLDDEIQEDNKPRRNTDTFLSRAARMLQGEPEPEPDDIDETVHSSTTASGLDRTSGGGGTTTASGRHTASTTPTGDRSLSPTDTAEVLSTAAATLMEGALPVRNFPNQLTSQPASLVHSDASSVNDDLRASQRRNRSPSLTHGYHQEELRCVIAIVRHGDRTPKQKLKVNMTEPHILQFFHDHSSDPRKDLKVKAKAPMTEFLQTVRTTLDELKGSDNESVRYQLAHMRDILERWKIVGLNRKLQIKPRKFEDYEDEETGETKQRCTEVQLILKWGGNLTKLGEKQSIRLGQRFRSQMYPDAPGGGILRLHSTFRHDLKIKTSDEGRVMKTAAAFAKGLLELEGDLPPILVSLVHKEKGSMHMLDPSGNKEVKMELDECKEKITANLQRDIDIDSAPEGDLEQLVGPKELTSLRGALKLIGNPRKTLVAIHETMGTLLYKLEEMLGAMGSGDETRIEGGEGLRGEVDDDVALSGVKLYKGETLLELTERWRFIYDRLYDAETDTFDLSRIPDVHDNVRFDVLHNPHLGLSATLNKLYHLAKCMADCVVPQEYGTTYTEKRSVGVKICHSLLEKIKYDIGVARTDNDTDMRYLINMDYSFDLNINTLGRRIRTRLYFTSESHLHTVLNVLRFAKSDEGKNSLLSDHGISIINSTPELCYLTQIVMRVFEDSRRDMNDPKRFRVELLFSPGATATPMHMNEMDRESDSSRFDTAPLQKIGRDDLSCQDVEEFFQSAIMAGRADEESYEVASTAAASFSAPTEKSKKSKKDKDKKKKKDKQVPKELSPQGDVDGTEFFPVVPTSLISPAGSEMASTSLETTNGDPIPTVIPEVTIPDLVEPTIENSPRDLVESTDGGKGNENDKEGNEEDENDPDEEIEDEHLKRILMRQYMWTTVAIGCFALCIGCFMASMQIVSDSSRKRRWGYSRRR